MKKELLEGLTEEQIKKVEACNSSEEILELAKKEGVSLTDEQLEAVSGGGCEAPNVDPFNPVDRDVDKDIFHKKPEDNNDKTPNIPKPNHDIIA